MILTPLQKLPYNVGDLGKIIVTASFECLPKVQKIAKSGHTGLSCPLNFHSPKLFNLRFEFDEFRTVFAFERARVPVEAVAAVLAQLVETIVQETARFGV